ncbi:MAG: hypothetical protein OEZ54_10990 [Gemmatimonadota bacterium]|nr:hypothetical protein [Gemmatimonadota bacterium]
MRSIIAGAILLMLWMLLLVTQKWTAAWTSLPLATGITLVVFGIGTLPPKDQTDKGTESS